MASRSKRGGKLTELLIPGMVSKMAQGFLECLLDELFLQSRIWYNTVMVMPGTKCGVLILRSLGALSCTRRLLAEGKGYARRKAMVVSPHL